MVGDSEVQGGEHTLNPYVDVILRLFSLAGVFVSFGEGVWRRARVSPDEHLPRQHKNVVQIQVEQGQREYHHRR